MRRQSPARVAPKGPCFYADKFAVVYEGRVWSMPRLTKDEQTAALLEIVLDGLTDLVAAESPLQ